MKKLISILLLLVLVIASTLMLDSCFFNFNTVRELGQLKFELRVDGYYVSAAGYSDDRKKITEVEIPDTYLGEPVVGIDWFYGCENLTSISIPDSVKKIDFWAFYGCKSLTSIDLPDSVEYIGDSAFYGCTALTSITIPDSVETIGEYAFASCTSLTSIDIPDGVKDIGYGAFRDCTARR